jgi:hypothetical protein
MTQQGRLFAVMSTFGIGIAIVYWFLTYDPTGSVLLLLFGIAAGIGAVAELLGSRGRRGERAAADANEAAAPSAGAADEGPEVQPVPRPGWAPIGLGFGLGGVALGAAFGPALVIAGVLVTLLSASTWLSAAVHETRIARAHERDALDDTRSSPPPAA